VRETYRKWWKGELKRPIVPVELDGRDPGRQTPSAPILSQATCAQLSIKAEDVVDRLDYDLSSKVFLGDAFPIVNMHCFGPGVAAAFMGARLDNSTGGVWFHPPRANMPIKDIHFEYDPDNVWFKRVKELCAAMMKRWKGQVLVSMTDLGGNLDILASFIETERLLLYLYDEPDEVKRLLREEHEMWHRYFKEINEILQPVNPGFSAWCSIYSDEPYYILQCDFSYMIGAGMFDEFVKPELEASVRKLSRSLYHLDGKGQLPHLDSILQIEGLGGVQWVPGSGNPDCGNWPEIYRRIFKAGKKTQLWGEFAGIEKIIKEVGVGPGIHYRQYPKPLEKEKEVRYWLERLGVEN